MSPTALTPRQVFLTVFAGCAGLLGFGLYLQHGVGLEPCPLCILQRYAFVLVALFALVAGALGWRGWARRLGAALMLAAALGGLGVAARQVWLQHNPPQVSACGPDLYFMLDAFPLAQVLPMLFRGEGDCVKVEWTFLGLSIAECALLCFAALAVIGLWQLLRREPPRV